MGSCGEARGPAEPATDRSATATIVGVEDAPYVVGGGGVGSDPDLFTVREALFKAASAFSLTVFSQRRAHANSSPRMPRPIGITMNAGPGSAIIAMPIARTVKPTMVMAMRLATRYATLSMMSGGGDSVGDRAA
jgi:hypothetical protein